MIVWIANYWGWLLAGMVFAGHFVFCVLAIREQRSGDGRPRLPCDRC